MEQQQPLPLPHQLPGSNNMEQQQPLPLPHQLPGSNNYPAGGPTAPPINFNANTSYGVHHHHGQSSIPHQAVFGIHQNYYPQQPQQLPPPPVGHWSTGLCGAHGEYWNCLVTHFCPWITFGQIAEIVDEGTTSCCAASLLYLGVQFCLGCCFTPMVSYVYRARIRHKFNIPPGRCCSDFCLHFCCECFALRQEWRELKRRGLNPSLGWQTYAREMYAKRQLQPTMQVPGWPPQMHR